MFLLLALMVQLTSGSSALRCESLFAKNSSLDWQSPLGRQVWIEKLNTHSQSAKHIPLQKKIRTQDQLIFRQLLAQQYHLSSWQPVELLQVVQFFNRLNVLPPPAFERALSEALRNSLYDWKEAEIYLWASLRKNTPMTFSSSFLTTWDTFVSLNFEDWAAKTQVEVLGAELYHPRSSSKLNWDDLIKQTTLRLKKTRHTQDFKSLKQLFRGLSWLKVSREDVSISQIEALIDQVQRHLEKQNLSLSNNGRSGSLAPERHIGWPVGRLQILMEHEFPGITGITEFSDVTVPGLFDPVDLYYPELRLVIEWDGPQHSWMQLTESAEWSAKSALRPFDVEKDKALRRQGYLVLRIPSTASHQLEDFSLRELILQQNPQAELPEPAPFLFYLNVNPED